MVDEILISFRFCSALLTSQLMWKQKRLYHTIISTYPRNVI